MSQPSASENPPAHQPMSEPLPRSKRPRPKWIAPAVIGVAALLVVVALMAGFLMMNAGDRTPPATVSNLAAAQNPAGNSVELYWRAPGDDGDAGTASQYDIRYSSSLVDNDEKFAAATPCVGEPAPAAPGTVQALEVTGLAPAATYYFALKTADEVPNWSPLSNSPYVTLESPDAVPPAKVTDLRPSFPTNSSVELRWKAPGDDGNVGTASQYDIRYATSEIDTETEFAAATPCVGEPAPAVAGTVQTFNVTSLANGAIHYFALKTADEVPNWSPLSNSTSILPNFALNDTTGSLWNLYDRILIGEPILLEFMHPDCLHCVEVVPPLFGIYTNYSPSLELVSVAVTGFFDPPNATMVDQFRTQYGAIWIHLVEASGTQIHDSYGIVAIPTFILVGKDGSLVYRHSGSGSMDVLVNEIEKELSS